MENSTQWSVDRLAASNLLAQLKLKATDEQIEAVARHFSNHRRSMIEWAAERVHDNVVRALEAAARDHFSRHSEEWVRGFGSAEELVLGAAPRDLLDLEPDRTRSRGQILRSMVRQARRI